MHNCLSPRTLPLHRLEHIALLTEIRHGEHYWYHSNVACGGLVVNLIGIKLLHAGAGESLNIQGVFLDVVSDLLGSIGVILAAVVIYLTGWWQADPIISVVIGLFILPRTWTLLKGAPAAGWIRAVLSSASGCRPSRRAGRLRTDRHIVDVSKNSGRSSKRRLRGLDRPPNEGRNGHDAGAVYKRSDLPQMWRRDASL